MELHRTVQMSQTSEERQQSNRQVDETVASALLRLSGFHGNRVASRAGGLLVLAGAGGAKMAGIRVYYTSVTGSREVKQRQSEVLRILDTNHMTYELVDVSVSESLLQEMRDKAGNPGAIPPQIFNGEHYCGNNCIIVLSSPLN
uniref:Uncharacterized protein n=1 Tax=Sphaerodactylus townsendi TaxID=933632 RepID=A0ACB8FXE5_9SAUR